MYLVGIGGLHAAGAVTSEPSLPICTVERLRRRWPMAIRVMWRILLVRLASMSEIAHRKDPLTVWRTAERLTRR
jgi:hypothetical protein